MAKHTKILEHQNDPTKTVRYLRQFTEAYLRVLLVEARSVHFETWKVGDYKTTRSIRCRMRAIVRELNRRGLMVSPVYSNPKIDHDSY
jgi:hypothetical protein